MPVYESSKGENILFGKNFTLCGIAAGAAITAVGSWLFAECLSDFVAKYRENYIHFNEAQRLLVEGGVSLYGSYIGIESTLRKWKELGHIRKLEYTLGRKLEGQDYPELVNTLTQKH